MRNHKETLGKNIRSIANRAGIEQSDLAKLAKIAQGKLSGYWNGQTMPAADTALAIARALGISVEQLLEDPNAKPAPAEHDILECAKRVHDFTRKTVKAAGF